MAEDIASLGVGVDTSQVDQGSKSLDQLTNAAGRTQSAMSGLTASAANAGAAVGRAASAVGAGVNAAAAGMGNAARSAGAAMGTMASAAGAAANGTVQSAQRVGQAFQNAGAQVAAAGTKINSVFTTIRSWGQTLMQTTGNLLSFGAAANSAANNVQRLNVAANQNLHVIQAGRYHTANLAAQFQDVAVQAQTATDPLQIALQQGTQMSMIFAGMGAAGAMRTFAGAIAAVFSPLTLMIILLTGVAAAGLQAVSWIPLMQSGLRALADIIPKVAVAVAILGATMAIAFGPQIIMGVVSLIAAIARLIVSVLGLAAAFAMANPFAAFIIGVGLAVTAAVLFRDELERIFGFDIVKSIKDWANFFISITVTTFQSVSDVWNSLPAIVGNAFIVTINSTMQYLTGYVNDIIRLIDDAIQRINELLPGSIGPNSGLVPKIGTIEAPQITNPFADEANTVFEKIGERWKTNSVRDWIGDIGTSIGDAADWAKKKLLELAATLGMDDISKAVKKARDYIDSQKADIEQLQLEIALVGQGSVAREKYMAILKAEQKIRELGIPLYGKEAQEIRRNAQEIANLTEILAKKKFLDDQMFRRRQLLRSPEEQAVAQELRGAGFADDLNSAEAEIVKQTLAVERLKDTWQSVFDVVDKGIDNFVDALFDGTKSMGDTLRQLGRDIAKLFFNLAVTNPIKNWLTGANNNTIADLGIFGKGATSGRGGGFGGILGKLFGAQSALSSMSVSAGTVIVNGAVSGIPGLQNLIGNAGKSMTSSVDGSVPPGLAGVGSPTSAIDKIVTGATGAASNASNDVFKVIGQTKGGIDLVNVRTAKGLVAAVDAKYAANFQGFIRELEKTGYDIKSIGGYNFRNIAGTGKLSNHALGRAIDINPKTNPDTGRGGALITDMPTGVGRMSDQFGLRWGGEYRSKKDAMHFEVASPSRASAALEKLAGTGNVAADSLAKTGAASYTAVKGLSDAAGGLTNFSTMLNKFPAAPTGGGGGWLSSLFGGLGRGVTPFGTTLSPTAMASITAGAGGLYHSGGTAGYATTTRTVPMSIFEGAARYHKGGFAGFEPGEVPAILKRGEPVFKSWEHARQTFAGNDNNSMDWDSIGRAMARHMKPPSIYNIDDPERLGDYFGKDNSDEKVMNVLRKNGGAGSGLIRSG